MLRCWRLPHCRSPLCDPLLPQPMANAGELATQVARDLLPALSAKGVKLFFVSIGTPERGVKFCEQTGARRWSQPRAGAALQGWRRAPICAPAQRCRRRRGCLGTARCSAHPPPGPPAAPPSHPGGVSMPAGFPPDRLLCDPTNDTYSQLQFKKGVKETFLSVEVRACVWSAVGPMHPIPFPSHFHSISSSSHAEPRALPLPADASGLLGAHQGREDGRPAASDVPLDQERAVGAAQAGPGLPAGACRAAPCCTACYCPMSAAMLLSSLPCVCWQAA